MDKGLKTALIVGGVIVGLLIVVPIIYWLIGGYQGGYGYGMMGGSFGVMWIMMPVLLVVFWGLVIWGIIAMVRGAWFRDSGSQTSGESALEVLKKRYARGEIGKEEFEAKKKDLA